MKLFRTFTIIKPDKPRSATITKVLVHLKTLLSLLAMATSRLFTWKNKKLTEAVTDNLRAMKTNQFVFIKAAIKGLTSVAPKKAIATTVVKQSNIPINAIIKIA